MSNKRTVLKSKLYTVTVYRGKGKNIQSITKFTDFAEAVDFAKETPADEQWSMTLLLTKTGEYSDNTDKPIDINLQVNGPGYYAYLYD